MTRFVIVKYCIYRDELFVILASDDVYNQSTSDSIVSPTVPYDEVRVLRTASVVTGDKPR